MGTSLDDPFTLILTVPRHLVGTDMDATSAVEPVLAAKFGWTHFDVLEPKDNAALYEDAVLAVERQGGQLHVVDAATGLVHVAEGADLFVRVVRLFPEGFPVGVYSPVQGVV